MNAPSKTPYQYREISHLKVLKTFQNILRLRPNSILRMKLTVGVFSKIPYTVAVEQLIKAINAIKQFKTI